MTDGESKPRLHRSVFAKLAAIMLVMAASLIGILAGVFWRVVVPTIHSSSQQLAVQFARQSAANGLDLAAAQKMATEMSIAVRYEGPSGSWSTDPSDPLTIDEARRLAAHHDRGSRQSRCVVILPDGHRYMFTWDFNARMQRIERILFLATAALMVALIASTYFVLRRLLRPLRSLGEGVARLGEGDLDIALPAAGEDEFGQLTAAFNRMAQRVREMVRARDQLLVDVSHELRSPLTRIKVALEFLPAGDKRQQLADDIAEMEGMVTELLELERLRDGKGLRPTAGDLAPLLRDAAAKYRGSSPGVEIVVAPESLPSTFDAEALARVLRNLLDNAVKYSLPDSRPVTITAADHGASLEVRITDNGPGIPAADLQTIFEPFFRLDRSRSRRTGGYGLGLSICKRILEAHGGSIAVEAAAERGAVFVLKLPGGG
jgi:signal transduction histidine kinase